MIDDQFLDRLLDHSGEYPALADGEAQLLFADGHPAIYSRLIEAHVPDLLRLGQRYAGDDPEANRAILKLGIRAVILAALHYRPSSRYSFTSYARFVASQILARTYVSGA